MGLLGSGCDTVAGVPVIHVLVLAHGRVREIDVKRLVPQDGRPLRIAMLAPPWIEIPPPAYGGIESVVALLCEALVARGHRVELLCAPGSRSPAHVRPLLPAAQPRRIGEAQFEADHVACAFAAIDAAARARAPFDVVHDHCGFTALAMADRLDTPFVHTVHGPFRDGVEDFYARHAAKGRIVCLSQAQARAAPPNVAIEAVVPNPIDLAAWPPTERKGDFLLWVGRLTPEKGPHRAIEVARRARRPLVLAGPVQPGYKEFFATCVEPHVDGSAVRYVGEIGGEKKRRMFGEALAFLMPIRWPEPFGMVMVEALAAGTPVLAFSEGAAPEIVEHGETGFLVRDEAQMAEAVAEAARLDPRRCRAAVGRWAPRHVAAAYEAVYRAAMEAPLASAPGLAASVA
jgi:glycosyltransferase involved in cell wall biosynthesis